MVCYLGNVHFYGDLYLSEEMKTPSSIDRYKVEQV